MMSREQVVHQSPVQPIVKRNRFFGLIIIFIVFAPMLLAYIMFQTGWGVSGVTTNKGQLLHPPTSVKSLTLSGEKNLFDELFKTGNTSLSHTKKWRLLVPISQQCNTSCQEYLYTTRQVHIRLAEKAYRVERVILSLDELSHQQKMMLAQDHPNIILANTSLDHFNQWLSSANVNKHADNYYYLVDQEGFAMMRYDTSHSGQDLLDDIKKLLKFTYDK